MLNQRFIYILIAVIFFSVALSSLPVKARLAEQSPPYQDKTEMIDQWKALCDKYPLYASYEVVGKSLQGKDIFLFKVGNPNGGRVMFDGETHGNEDGGTELEYLFVRWLLESNDQVAIHILQSNYNLFIPIINMDSTWRQNLRRQYVLVNGTTIDVPHGVDLNRNAVTGFSTNGSGDPNNDYNYRGLYGGSEPETQAWRSAVAKYKPSIYLNTHIGEENYPLWYSNDTDLTRTIISNLDSVYQSYGFATPFYKVKNGQFGGEIAYDATFSFGASGWTIEFCGWKELQPTLDQWTAIWYPKAQPLFIAFNKSVEVNSSFWPLLFNKVFSIKDMYVILGIIGAMILISILLIRSRLMWRMG